MNTFYSGRAYLEERRHEKFWSNLSTFVLVAVGLMIIAQLVRYFLLYV